MGKYRGIAFGVFFRDGERYISIGRSVPDLIARGANLKLLGKIGDQLPEDVIDLMLASITPEKAWPVPKPEVTSRVVYHGLYAGVFYEVVETNGVFDINLGVEGREIEGSANRENFTRLGADMMLLKDIATRFGDKKGNFDPDDAMAALFASIPNEK